eukprot:92856_1
MATLFCGWICFQIGIVVSMEGASDHNKLNALSPPEMSQLIASHNPEGYPMVECAINNLIVIIQTRPDWGPLGQKRFLDLVNDRYYDGAALFRAIDNFLVQFGLASSKAMRQKWRETKNIPDDPPSDVPFTRGIMSFAGSGKNTRGTQIFFTLAKLSTHLGKEAWEVPFGKVIYGDDALKSINKEYDDKVSQTKIWRQGYEYLTKEFPNLSYIEYCRTISEREMMYYVHSGKGNENENEAAEVVNENEEVSDEENSQTVFIVKIVSVAVGVGVCIFVVIKLLKKTPGKKN